MQLQSTDRLCQLAIKCWYQSILNFDTISFCRHYFNCLPFVAVYDLLRLNFLCAKFKQGHLHANNSFDDCDYADLCKLCDKYAVYPSCSKQYAKLKVWTFVEEQLGFWFIVLTFICFYLFSLHYLYVTNFIIWWN